MGCDVAIGSATTAHTTTSHAHGMPAQSRAVQLCPRLSCQLYWLPDGTGQAVASIKMDLETKAAIPISLIRCMVQWPITAFRGFLDDALHR
jgi:hypothetical protein